MSFPNNSLSNVFTGLITDPGLFELEEIFFVFSLSF